MLSISRTLSLIALFSLVQPLSLFAVSSNIVISQVYGGGGNSGATLRNDFVELFNLGGSTVSVSGWTVQYAPATGSSWSRATLSGSIEPGEYYLLQLRQGTGGTTNLPSPDATASINLSLSSGKVALVSNPTSLSGSCPMGSSVVDFVGYGTANCSEGSTAPTLSNTTAIRRDNGGCEDTDSNSSNFSTITPSPRNSSTAKNLCAPVITPEPLSASGSADPEMVEAGQATFLTVSVTPATEPASTTIQVTANLVSIGGSTSQSLESAGGNTFSFSATVASETPAGTKTIPVDVSDSQARSTTTSISLEVTSPQQEEPPEQEPAADPVTELIFPHMADGQGWKTTFLLTNGAGSSVDGTLSFFSSLGTPLQLTVGGTTGSELMVSIPAKGSLRLQSDGMTPVVATGWARLSVPAGASVGGNAVFQLFTNGNLFSEASVPSSVPTRSASFLADEEDGFRTGFAMANSGSEEAVGTVTLLDTSGVQVGSWVFNLLTQQHTATFVDQIVPNSRTGRVEIVLTAGSVSVTSLRFHSSSVFSTLSVGQPSGISALFSPNGGIQDEIIAKMDQAASTIDIAMYSFTADKIREALIRAKDRGVQIRIVADSSQANGQGGEIPTLEGLGFMVRRLTGSGGGLMHNKYMIVDQKILFTGSYNWSANAEDNSFENAVFIEGDDVIQKFLSDFERLWELAIFGNLFRQESWGHIAA